MKEFETNQKPKLEGYKNGQLNVKLQPYFLAKLLPQYTKIFEEHEKEEGKEQVELGKDSMGQLTDLEKQLQAQLRDQREILKQKNKEADMIIQEHRAREQELRNEIQKLKNINEEINEAKRNLDRKVFGLEKEIDNQKKQINRSEKAIAEH